MLGTFQLIKFKWFYNSVLTIKTILFSPNLYGYTV